MTEIERIIDQLNRAFAGEAWHGPAVIEILEGITAQHAAAANFSLERMIAETEAIYRAELQEV